MNVPPAAPERLSPTPRTALGRHSERGSFDRATIHAILDQGLVCHLGFAGPGGEPCIIPTAYGRAGDTLYVHGAVQNRALGALRGGATACLAVTLIDGLVLARSAFHHSMNYRSVIVYGSAREITGEADKRAALDAIVDHALPGRSQQARRPSDAELRATRVLAFSIAEASAKIRTGPPIDRAGDLPIEAWAGEIPLVQRAGPLRPAADLIGHPAEPRLAGHFRSGDPGAGGTLGG